MLTRTQLIAGVATTALYLAMASTASAQSTGSLEIDEAEDAVESVVVTGVRGTRSIEGVVRNETAPKARTSIDQQYIATQPAGQTIFQSLNQTPGLNFTNNDPYGSSGGNVRLRGQDGNRVALLWDGIPLNDTGNYATFTNQLLDPELVSQVNVNTGTADVDSPSPAAVGGTINYTTIRPTDDFGIMVQPSVGSWDFRRLLAQVNTGEFGPFGTSAWVAGSYQQYDKWRGPGELEKTQGNAYLFQEFGGDNFIGVGIHYNENRNNSYRQVNQADWLRFNGGLDNDYSCQRAAAVTGTAQNENNQNVVVNSQGQTVTGTSCTNFFELRNNPSNTGNIRAQARYGLTDNLTLTFDPYFQYTLANGGGFAVLAENDGRLRGAATTGGADLNGDTDVLDQVTIYTPSNTNTRRYGFTSSLLYELAEDHQFRVAYTVDSGQHRQTGEGTFVTASGAPDDVFGGKDGYGRRIVAADGVGFYRTRDRYSIASLSQIAGQYRGRLLEDRLILDLGIRAPFFKRELNQYCYTQDAVADPRQIGGFNVRCTTENPIAQATGAVRFAGVTQTQTRIGADGQPVRNAAGVIQTDTVLADFVRPYSLDFEYDAVLPNVGASYEFLDNHRIFGSYAKGFAAPRTDNLYNVGLQNGQVVPVPVQPEESDNFDLGYRYSAPGLIVYGTVFHNEFTNRIVQSFDPDLGFSIDRNVGAVIFKGLDFQIGWDPIEQVTLSTFYSYLDAELQDDIPGTTAGSSIPTAGKKLVEVPENTFGGRVTFRPVSGVDLGLQFKYVDSRFANDINTEVAPDYTLWDFDARFGLERFGTAYESSYVQLNVTNLFDERYLGSISSQAGANPSPATYQVGSPTTVQLSLRHTF